MKEKIHNGIATTITPPVEPRCRVKSHRMGRPSKPRYHELVHDSPGRNTPNSATQTLSRPLPIAHDQCGSFCTPHSHGTDRLCSSRTRAAMPNRSESVPTACNNNHCGRAGWSHILSLQNCRVGYAHHLVALTNWWAQPTLQGQCCDARHDQRKRHASPPLSAVTVARFVGGVSCSSSAARSVSRPGWLP